MVSCRTCRPLCVLCLLLTHCIMQPFPPYCFTCIAFEPAWSSFPSISVSDPLYITWWFAFLLLFTGASIRFEPGEDLPARALDQAPAPVAPAQPNKDVQAIRVRRSYTCTKLYFCMAGYPSHTLFITLSL